jgi:hypothetical protein
VPAPWTEPLALVGMHKPLDTPEGATRFINFCLPGMVSLAELLKNGDVTWSGYMTKTNEFEFRPTKGTPPSQIKAWVRTKVTSLENKWPHMEKTYGEAAWRMWACAIGHVMDNARTSLTKSSLFTSGREKAGNDTNYITVANICRCHTISYIKLYRRHPGPDK